ncbi:MAG: PilZ domain-containing protein [Spirochaetales bacterium]|nr:PilZ domain-containing protein [Spirochaetales bacterium]
MIRKKGYYRIFFILLLCLCFRVVAGTNLIRNGGFEEDYMGSVAMWSYDAFLETEDAVRFYINEADSHSGNRSLAIANILPNDSRAIQWVGVKPDTFYRLSCWIKIVEADADKTGANITVLGLKNTSRDLRDTGSHWEHVVVYGKTGPDQEELPVVVRLGFYGQLTTGIAYYDDIAIEETAEVPGEHVIDFSTGNYLQKTELTKKPGLYAVAVIVTAAIILLSGIIAFLFFKTDAPAKAIRFLKSRFFLKRYGGEKRRYIRKRRELDVAITRRIAGGYTKTVNLRTRDISLGGAFVKTDDLSLFRINGTVVIEIEYKNTVVLKCRAEVVRSEVVKNRFNRIVKKGFGIRFIDPSSENLKRLGSVLNV